MQDSSGKSIKPEKGEGRKAGTGAFGIKYTLYAVIVLVMLLSSCTSLKEKERTVPYGAIPGDCLFYFAADASVIPDDSPDLDKGIKLLLSRTDEITGGSKRGEYYLLFKGKYPDAFTERKIAEAAGWQKDQYRKCYYNERENLSVYFVKNNHIFVSNYINRETGEKPLEKIYNSYNKSTIDSSLESASGFKIAEYFLNRDRETLFQLYSYSGSGLISMFPEIKLESAGIKDIEIFLREYENSANRYILNSSMNFTTSKEAGKFSTIIKMLFLDLIRKTDSGITAADGKKFTVEKDRNTIQVSDIIVSDKVTGDFFNKLIRITIRR